MALLFVLSADSRHLPQPLSSPSSNPTPLPPSCLAIAVNGVFQTTESFLSVTLKSLSYSTECFLSKECFT